ncbi:MAG: hypothetical protein AAF892_08550 [Cyanobacteria bacterium P01_D01_bin.71]
MSRFIIDTELRIGQVSVALTRGQPRPGLNVPTNLISTYPDDSWFASAIAAPPLQ